jgi:hypothetical protein
MQEKWCISSKDYHIDTCVTESNRNSHPVCFVYDTTAFKPSVVLESMHDETHGLTKYLQMTTDVMHISHKLSETSSKAGESESRSVLMLKPIAPSAYNRVNRRAASFTYNFNYGKFYEQWSVMVYNNTYSDIFKIVQN